MRPINTPDLAARESLARRFASAQPFRHVVIDGFLEPEFCQRLLADFPRFEDRFALNEMGQVGGKAVRMDVRDISDAYKALDAYIQTPEFLALMSEITGIPNLLYDPDYVGGGTHENRQGQGLEPHVDFNYHPRTRWHRRLNLIVYLNPEWEESWGGNIEFHSDPWKADDKVQRARPLLNRAVIFETNEVSWHGFSTIRLPESNRQLTRKSFAIYLYTVERPPAETEVPHATIYVPDAMPAHLRVGSVLTAADCAELERRFGQLRGQLKFLYDREKHFGGQIASLARALDEARAATRIDVQGYAVQPRGATGIWPDGWAGREFSFCLAPTRAARSVSIEVWVPPAIVSGQNLEISAGSWRGTETVRGGARKSIKLPLAIGVGETVEVKINASQDWVPRSSGESADERALAYRLLSVVVDH